MAQNFLFRVNQYTMLGTLPMELVAEFWRKHPFSIGGRELSTREALERIFSKGSTPTECFFDMCAAIERFYVDHGQDFGQFRRVLAGFSSRQSGIHHEVFPVVARAFHEVLRRVSPNILETMLDCAIGATTWGIEHYRALNREFLLYLDRRVKAEVVYHENHEMVAIDGRRVVRSVPARILRKVLEEHTTTGRTELEYWELLGDQATIPNREHHHLSRRLERLEKTLVRKTNVFELSRPRRGTVGLRVKRPFAFVVKRED